MKLPFIISAVILTSATSFCMNDHAEYIKTKKLHHDGTLFFDQDAGTVRALSEDGNFCTSKGAEKLTVWSIADRDNVEKVTSLPIASYCRASRNSLKFIPKENDLVVHPSVKGVNIYSLAQKIKRSTYPHEEACAIDITQRGLELATSSELEMNHELRSVKNGIIKIWHLMRSDTPELELGTRRTEKELLGIKAVKFIPHSPLLAVVYHTFAEQNFTEHRGMACIYDINSGKEVAKLGTIDGECGDLIHDAVVSDDGKLLLLPTSKGAKIVAIGDWREIAQVGRHYNVKSAQFDSNASAVLGVSGTKSVIYDDNVAIRKWGISDNTEEIIVDENNSSYKDGSYTMGPLLKGGKTLAATGYNKIAIWDLDTFKL